uniref:Fic family protein n=1 Tax=Paractinoplanes polyasparticus TaxID=2856853 RepID=UPI001C848F25|nr:Fic family protein [Actinoplanes polyasparticus]
MSPVTAAQDREYLASHPWITFMVNLQKLTHKTWLLLGEAESKSHHVAGVPLRPEVARRLHAIYLSKGIHGTTSIEGNTLSEEEVLQRVAGELELPPSRAYLGIEVDNIIAACNRIVEDLAHHRPMELTPERIASFNKQVLANLDLEDGVVPGQVRTHSVVVLNYRGAPAGDCDYLLQRMCDWLNELDTVAVDDEEMTFTVAVLKAILAHLYIAWIHPFGDGNGRTARLIEFQLLIQAGVPLPAAHLLSDFYNKTREAYYRALSRTSRPPYPVEGFIHYAMQGFVDELREQLQVIREEQMRVTWENFVHQSFPKDSPARHRQRCVVLDLGTRRDPVAPTRLPEVSPRLARLYADKGTKTLTRDINELVKMQLVRRVPGGIVANFDLIRAFLPMRAE